MNEANSDLFNFKSKNYDVLVTVVVIVALAAIFIFGALSQSLSATFVFSLLLLFFGTFVSGLVDFLEYKTNVLNQINILETNFDFKDFEQNLLNNKDNKGFNSLFESLEKTNNVLKIQDLELILFLVAKKYKSYSDLFSLSIILSGICISLLAILTLSLDFAIGFIVITSAFFLDLGFTVILDSTLRTRYAQLITNFIFENNYSHYSFYKLEKKLDSKLNKIELNLLEVSKEQIKTKERFFFSNYDFTDNPIIAYKTSFILVRSNQANDVLKTLNATNIKETNFVDGMNESFAGKKVFAFNFEGWTVLHNQNILPVIYNDSTKETCLNVLNKLSDKFSEAHIYANHRVSDYYLWVISKNGQIFRAYGYSGSDGEIVIDECTKLSYEENKNWPKENMTDQDWEIVDFPKETDVLNICEKYALDITKIDKNSKINNMFLASIDFKT